jgi:L-2-hydroxyglutarate oxidase LhgO
MSRGYDFLIIGGGIVGFSIGNEILKREPKSSVLIAEKEAETGSHASGRNSGVLHAGFYYSPDSLKARFCLEGNYELRKIIESASLPLNECGKVVVAKDESDLPRLLNLFERGIKNGSKIELLDAKELPKFEPLAKTHKQFLWSPKTAVSDPLLVNNRIRELFQTAGGRVVSNALVKFKSDNQVLINGKPVEAGRIINSAGANAIHLAHSIGIGQDYAQLPVIGLYKITENKELPLRTLIYPVPNPENPFLGVHFTLTVSGEVKIGPTAIPILGREQYTLLDLPNFADISESTKAIVSMLKSSPANLFRLARTELPKISSSVLVREGIELVPSLNSKIKWKKKRPGIRAQLVDLKTGNFEMDFIVRQRGNTTHILNAVSPGWTSAIPFAKWIVDKYLS